MSTTGPQPPRAPGDVFPATQVSWIDDNMERGPSGRSEINRHIMQVYRWPLRVYFMGTRDRWLGEPEDVVDGFFADRLSRPQFIADWRSSGLKLRHWLINAFCFYLREMKRARHRHSHEDLTQAGEPEISPTDLRELDKAYIASIVQQALAEAERSCNAQGLGAHWQVFSMHFAMGRPYDQFVDDMGIDPARAVVMARTAKKKFQSSLRSLLSKETDSADLDVEIRQLLEGY